MLILGIEGDDVALRQCDSESKKMLNSNGLRLSPCFRPFEIAIGSVNRSLIRTDAVVFSSIVRMILSIEPFTPTLCRRAMRPSLHKRSYALRTSMKQTYKGSLR